MAMAGGIGIGAYDDDEPYESYVKRLEMYFTASEITDEDRKKVCSCPRQEKRRIN